jgi:hypothetical protein
MPATVKDGKIEFPIMDTVYVALMVFWCIHSCTLSFGRKKRMHEHMRDVFPFLLRISLRMVTSL